MFGLGFGSSKSKNSFEQFLDPTQLAAVKQIYDRIPGYLDSNLAGMGSQIPYSTGYSNNISDSAQPAYWNNLQGGVYNGLGIGNQLMQSLNQSLNSPTQTSSIYAQMMGGNGNNYADAMRNQYVKDANRASENMFANLDARVGDTGLAGSSRHGVAQGIGLRGINDALQSNMAQLGYNTFDKDLQNKLNIAQMADQGTLQRQQMMQQMLGQQQGTVDNAINQGSNMQNLGLGAFAPYLMQMLLMGNAASVIGDPSVLSKGSGSSSSMNANASFMGGGGGGGGGGMGNPGGFMNMRSGGGWW